MGPNGELRITAVPSHTNSASSKTLRLRPRGMSGAAFMNCGNTTNASHMTQRIIQTRSSQPSQVSGAASIVSALAPNAGAPATGAPDTSVAQGLVISGQLANAGETVALQSCLAEVAYGV